MSVIPDEIEEVLSLLGDDRIAFSSDSIRLDPFLWLESPQLDQLAAQIVALLDGKRSSPRERKDSARDKLTFAVKILLLNFLKLHKWPTKLFLAVPLGMSDYTSSKRYGQPELSYKTFIEAYECFKDHGWLNEVIRGYSNQGKGKGLITRAESTAKLNQAFDKLFPDYVFFTVHPNKQVLYLKDTKKRLMPYEDTEYTRQVKANLGTINQTLSRHWYDLSIPDDAFLEMANRMSSRSFNDDEAIAATSLTSRTLYRVYNNGGRQNKDFTQGGRFYGGWWEVIPSEYRRHITIDGVHTVEADYTSLHPRMLYALEKIPLEGNAYEAGDIPRKWLKLAFQQLLNGKEHYAIPSDFNPAKEGITWEGLREALRERHAPIAKYFGTGYGLKLQKLDADILEQVLLHFCNKDIPCLPVHDSIVIQHTYADELMQVMQAKYFDALGGDITIKLESYPVSPNSESPEDSYAAYDNRQAAWRIHQANQQPAP